MSDQEITFKFNFDKFFATTFLGVMAMLAVRCAAAFIALAVISSTDMRNLLAFAGILMLAFSSLFSDVVIAAIVSFVFGAKGWSRKAAVGTCAVVGLGSMFLFGGFGG